MKWNDIKRKWNSFKNYFKFPFYILTVQGHYRNRQTEDRYDSISDSIRVIADKLQPISTKAIRGEYGANSRQIYDSYNVIAMELRDIFIELQDSNRKFTGYLFMTSRRIERHKKISRRLEAKKERLNRLVCYLENFTKDIKPVGQKFIPVLDPYGEENWDN
jgi:hypothetical protein